MWTVNYDYMTVLMFRQIIILKRTKNTTLTISNYWYGRVKAIDFKHCSILQNISKKLVQAGRNQIFVTWFHMRTSIFYENNTLILIYRESLFLCQTIRLAQFCHVDHLLYKKLLNWKLTKRSKKNLISCQKTMPIYMNIHFNSIKNVSRLLWLVYSHIKYGIIT